MANRTVLDSFLANAERFKNLKDYFEGLEDDDLAILSRDALIDAARPEHKLLMHVFVEKNLRSFLNRPHASEEPREIFGALLNAADGKTMLVFDLRQKLRSVAISEGRKTWDEAEHILLQQISQFGAWHGSILFDFSENHFMDVDLPLLCNVVTKVMRTKAASEASAIVRIRTDHLFRPDPHVLELLSNAKVEFLDVCMNPFAT